MKINASIIWKELKDYTIITLGCLLYCLAWTHIFVPNEIISGGITGLCTAIQYGTGFPLAWSYGIFNVILLILGFLILGKSFGIRTIYALVMITVMLDLLPMLIEHDILPGLVLKESILNPILAALLEALGISILLSKGSSSGGTDIIALIINKYWPITPGTVYMTMDIVIIASLLLIPGKTIDHVVYGYIAVIVFSVGLDYILLGSKSSVQILVFSEKYQDIADYINNKMNRGVTALNAIGWYSKKEKNVLMIFVRRSEMGLVTSQIKKVDPNAFVAITPVKDVYGEGFEEIKTGLKLKKDNPNNTASND